MNDSALLIALEHQRAALVELAACYVAQREAIGARSIAEIEQATSQVEEAIQRVSNASAESLRRASEILGVPVVRLGTVLESEMLSREAWDSVLQIRAAAVRAQREMRISSRVVRKVWGHQENLLRSVSGERTESPTYVQDPIRRQSKQGASGRFLDGSA